MDDIQKSIYEFDVNGYVVVKNALDSRLITEINDFWQENLLGHYLHDVNLNWSRNWRAMVDIEPVYLILDRLFSSRFRLDHIFCADENFVSAGGRMHHQSDMFEEGVFYFVKNNKIFNGLTGVLYALSDMDSNVSHFCCIPASHRANFVVPDEYRNPNFNPLIKHIFLEKGDALVFSEALVHGTFHVESGESRRAIFARYTNSYSYYRRPAEHVDLASLPPTPNHSRASVQCIDRDKLTERQRRLVTEPAYARGKLPL
ncbi:phytanoyl-CoA dioxygenase family protein [Burkholderia oklahomensis]|uniref:phytanoyl-CoA dioxygenase family protein n=1 Tax=Burkholderia oklahomensis TaxID=342113 RepID=UPI0005D8B3FE|nr:phytanoyl-CoA dioxygenase family protein [Burkholderia oklahomensis]AJX32217.1 phytanoyl-CoA dioxygenase family protein [Burkholderia oklahomensis C6786]MBI0360582.1 phytanoyl-CoA dioxygenase family protein [Burkholderia oklahomensis]SUW59962.1 Phytanoyl-CoA dioxygenase (PhyH) [Burkholderia oklahomensis]